VTALDPGTVAGHPAVPDLTAHLLREHRVAPWMVLIASPESPGSTTPGCTPPPTASGRSSDDR
jgi:hypothetical protein